MKIALLCESGADEAGLWELLVALVGPHIERADPPRLRTRGWPALLQVLPTVIKHLYFRTGTDALVILADGDGSDIHDPTHEGQKTLPHRCRFCRLREAVESTLPTLTPVESRLPLKVAVAVASPSVEAWYAFASTRSYTEGKWRETQRKQPDAAIEIRSLKRQVYGLDRPSLELETSRAVALCQSIAADLDLLETAFPNGFGVLAAEVRSWLAASKKSHG